MLLLALASALAGDLEVTSNLEGAEILLDGQPTGEKTPATFTDVAPGKHAVKVVSGCQQGEAVVVVPAKGGAKASVLAIGESAGLTIVTRPSSASVRIGDQKAGSGDRWELECGEWPVKVSASGYVPLSFEVELEGQQEKKLYLPLTKEGTGSLVITTQPRGATVSLDGEEMGSGTVHLPNLAEGEHTLLITADGYKKLRMTVTLSEGEILGYNARLVAKEKAGESKWVEVGKGVDALEVLSAPSGDDEGLSDGGDEGGEESGGLPDLDSPEVPTKGSKGGSKSGGSKSGGSKGGGASNKQLGAGLIAAGTAGVVGSVFTYNYAFQGYKAYAVKYVAATNNPDLQDEAQAYFSQTVVPRYILFGTTTALTLGAFTGGALTLIEDDGASLQLAPLPGGGMLTWGGQF